MPQTIWARACALLKRLLKSIKRRFTKHREREVYIVFARLSIQSSDPIIALVSTEAEVLALREEFVERSPEVEITWMNYPVQGSTAQTELVHIVTQCGRLSPVVIGTFALKQDAEEYLEGHRPSHPLLQDYVELVSHPVGWRAPGEPWLEQDD